MKDLISNQNKVLIIASVVFIVLFIFCFYLAMSSESAFLYFLVLLFFLGIIYSVRELIFFNDNFGNIHRHLVNWEYPNGDKLIVTCWGLMKHNTTIPKLSVSNKFEGLKWGLDNAKDLAENLIKNEGNPLTTLLPSIEFSTTSNRIDDYITFSFVDKIDLTFVDIGRGFLIINIEKKNYNTKYTLTYPLPPSKKSLESEVDIFDKRISNRNTPVRALFIEKSLIEEILNEESSDPE
jgi:hypothetical protein